LSIISEQMPTPRGIAAARVRTLFRPAQALRSCRQGRIPQNRVPPSPSMAVPAEINPPPSDRGETHANHSCHARPDFLRGASAGREMRLLSLRAMVAQAEAARADCQTSEKEER